MVKSFKATIVRDGAMCFIPLTFDPKPVFGKVRAPVKVTLNGSTYRSTIAAMGGPPAKQAKKAETRLRRIARVAEWAARLPLKKPRTRASR